MNRGLRIAPLLIVALLVAGAVASVQLSHPTAAAKGGVVADHYIVTFKPGVDPVRKSNEKARAYGLQVRHVYVSALGGFAGFIPPGQLKKLQNDPDVASIVEDRYVAILADSRPTGIRRSQADRNATSQIGSGLNPITADVAVIDTGIDPAHADLRVVGGVNCVPGESSYADQHGHGTHVAGTVGALDNGSGVVGVAPGVRLWAVRVLNANGEGQFSDVICGIDWVTANAGVIDVANMSLGGEGPVGSCDDGSLHEAVCQSVAAGVTYVVAAGNSAINSSSFVPAAFEEVITVSAIQDMDGAPGGKAGNFLFADDALAYFSNYGQPVDIAAPGYNIYSTWTGNSYNYSSGTSMASPHVAGAAAIVRHLDPGASPAAVRGALLGVAWPQNSADGFTGDLDGFAEPLLNVGAIGGDPLPPPPPACALDSSEATVGSRITISCVNFAASEAIDVHWDTTSTNRVGYLLSSNGSATGSFTVPAATGGAHLVIAEGAASGIEISLPFTVIPGLKLSGTSGKVGTGLSATLSGFPAGAGYELLWDDGATPIKTGITSSSGGATVFVSVPVGVRGAHQFRATTDPSGPAPQSATAGYSIVPSVSLSPAYARVGTATTVNLRGYAAGEVIDVFFHDHAGSRSLIGQASATEIGSASLGFVIPDATKGAHTIEGVGNDGGAATATLTVYSALTLSKSSGTVGSAMTVTATGLGSEESVSVRWYETTTTASAVTTLATAVTSTAGRASFELTVPDTIGGTHRVEVTGPASGTVYAYYTVNAAIALSPVSGLAETTVAATLTGYAANETITVKWFTTATASISITTVSASITGSATAEFVVPTDAAVGDHKVEATGDTSFRRASTIFAVQSSGPPPPVDPYCTLDRATGPVGTAVVITCGNFAASEYIYVHWDDTSTTRRTAIWTGSSKGGKATFYVPDATGGEHRVIALGSTSAIQVEQLFTVTSSLKLSAVSAKVGSYVTATLKGFGSSESVELTWDGGSVLTRVTVSAVGSASVGIRVPETVKGTHSVGAAGATSGPQATTTLAVEPSLALSPAYVYVGSNVVITLRGYAASESVTLWWYGGSTGPATFATVAVDHLGSGSATFTVPDATKGTHRLEGGGDAGSLASANLTVASRLMVSVTSGTVGTTVVATLTGFGEAEQIRLEWFDTSTSATTLTYLTTTSDGSASDSFTVPEATNGLHKVQVTGTVSGASAYLYFSVRPSLALSPAAGTPGTSATVFLTGYRSGETVNVSWFSTSYQSSVVASGVASVLGSASITFAVPTDASIGDHKVEAVGKSSYARASSLFSVQHAAQSVGSTSNQIVTPTVDVPISDDFSASAIDGLPIGWLVAPGSSDQVTIKVKGAGGNGRLTLAAPAHGPASVRLIRDGALFTRPDVQVQLRFGQRGSAAGLVLAWQGPHDYVAVVANADADRLEVVEIAGGVVRSWSPTPDGSVAIEHGRDYWLRAETGTDAGGNAWVSLYWSTDGQTFQPIGAALGLANLAGGVGLTAGGDASPDAEFDDFLTRPSQATSPVTLTSPEPPASENPVAAVETEIDPTATAAPIPTEDPSPITEPTAEPTPTATPSPEPQPTDTPTSEPNATVTPTTEAVPSDPPVEEGSEDSPPA